MELHACMRTEHWRCCVFVPGKLAHLYRAEPPPGMNVKQITATNENSTQGHVIIDNQAFQKVKCMHILLVAF
jgi:hypothetical protein